MTEILNIPVRIPRAPRGSLNEAQQYALNNNLVHYQGNPCNKNHSGLRYTKMDVVLNVENGNQQAEKQEVSQILSVQKL